MTVEPWHDSERLAPLLAFRKSILEFDNYLQKLLTDAVNGESDDQELFDALVIAHAIKGDFTDVFGMFSAKVGEHIKDKEVSASNGQTIEKKFGSDRKGWEHEKLASEVLRRLQSMSVDMDTGEVLISSEEIAMKLLDYVQPSYWRTKELNKIGINADNYCEVGDVKTSIIIRKAK